MRAEPAASGGSISYTFIRLRSGSGMREASFAVANQTAPDASIGISANSSVKRIAVCISSNS